MLKMPFHSVMLIERLLCGDFLAVRSWFNIISLSSGYSCIMANSHALLWLQWVALYLFLNGDDMTLIFSI